MQALEINLFYDFYPDPQRSVVFIVGNFHKGLL